MSGLQVRIESPVRWLTACIAWSIAARRSAAISTRVSIEKMLSASWSYIWISEMFAPSSVTE